MDNYTWMEDYDWADELARCIDTDPLFDQEYFTEPEESISFSSIPIANTQTGITYLVTSPAVASTYAALTRSTSTPWSFNNTW
jgi:hypothetical protein